MPSEFARLAERLRKRLSSHAGRRKRSVRGGILTYAESLASGYSRDLMRALRDGQLASWLASAVKTARPLAIQQSQSGPPPKDGYFPATDVEPAPSVRFPQVELAAKWLATRLDFTPTEFATLDRNARDVAFTVAHAVTTDAVSKVRKALIRDIQEGGTKAEFRDAVEEAFGAGAISESGSEAIYRTYTARAMASGQQTVLDSPIVADEFPFVLYSATHDGRVDPEHLAMEHLGINGTAVYYADDPVIRKFWPPWRWNCRCAIIPLNVADAARRGVLEAREWLKTGRPPLIRTYVPHPPFDLPKGWIPSGKIAAV